MALSVETGLFAADTADATTTVSCGFTGKALILFGTNATAESESAQQNSCFSFGFSDGTTHRSIQVAGDNAVSTSNVAKGLLNSALGIITSSPAITNRINGVSFGASSFDLTWASTPAAAYRIGYILLGGADITNVKVGSTSTITMASTGAQTETGIGFQGDFAIFLFNGLANTATFPANGGIGFAIAGKQFTLAWGVDDAQTMSAAVDGVSYINASGVLSYITNGAGTIDGLASFTEFTSDGFTINVSNATALASGAIAYLVIKGGQWDLGVQAKPTTAIAQSVTSMTFQPKVAFWTSGDATVDATVTAGGAGVSGGAAVSTSTEALASLRHNDAIDTIVWSASHSSRVATDRTTSTSADFTSFNSDGWTITWDGTGVATLQGWFAAGDNAVAPTTTGQGWWGKSGNVW